ncbi:histidine kinase [Paucibacter sp. B2R-40]|uniref:sensor histidine kinase n=1 Tax=Paucibacter sp. B2R-40 TaxID=2893554 RepID=UPI0021E47DCC|nr:histidine kinase [Paucibacter sp. B2R-40]MCV2357001.1 histidine kinase [Paucibacter sp. B2R-40]
MAAHISVLAAAPEAAEPSDIAPRLLIGRALQGLLLCTGVWLLIWLLMALAQTADAANTGRSSLSLVQVLRLSLSAFPPYILFSWLLFLHAWRRPQQWASPELQLRVFLVSISLFALAWLSYFWWLQLLRHGKLPDEWWALVLKNRWYSLFYDLVLAGGAFCVQAFIVSKASARARAAAQQREQTDNLRLRLTLLQGQLEPHFLFNALNSISSLVRAADRSLALTALARVSELLRYALRASKTEWVSVQDEMNFMRDYLELQSLRYGASLDVRWDVADAGWDRAACPPLMFQPLVENAIRHGLEACEGEGFVYLSLAREDGFVRLSLRNPVGSEPQGQRGHGLGLAATRERLHILYGEGASLVTRQAAGSFTTELMLPSRELHE